MISFHRHVIPLLLATASSSASASSPRRLSIFSGDSIATNVLNTQQAAVGTTFTLHAKRAESGEEQAIPVVSTEALTAEAASTAAAATTATTAAIPEDFSINVRVAEPAITSSTILLVGDGEGVYVNEADLATILVSDEEGTIAMIAVEKVENGRVDGIIHTAGGDDIKFTQGGEYGQEASVTPAEPYTPPVFESTSEVELEVVPGVEDLGVVEEVAITTGDVDESTRSLTEADGHDGAVHSSSSSSPSSRARDAFEEIKRNLQGQGSNNSSNVRLGQRRRTQNMSYNYNVDIFLEIDQALCDLNNENCVLNGIGPKTLNYISSLFAGANSVYEKEIDTHLNILTIQLTNNYDGMDDSNLVYRKMTSIYARPQQWHYTAPNGVQPDLHLAMLGNKNINSWGKSNIGTLCNPYYAFAYLSWLEGYYTDMNSAAVYDSIMLMKMIGYNFGAFPTYSDNYYPRIDYCGSLDNYQWPGEGCAGIVDNSATIMSSCWKCGNQNFQYVAYTFGGEYLGFGDRGSIESYRASPLLTPGAGVTTEGRQVNALMYKHVSSRGECTRRHGSMPTPPKQGKANKPGGKAMKNPAPAMKNPAPVTGGTMPASKAAKRQ